MTKQIKDTRERGVALLFALGLLALMSVLGVAFVTNALNAQKTAVNIGARNQSRILLDSAINRVMIGITAALHQRVNADLSKVYSSGDGTIRGEANPDDAKQDLLNDEASRMKIFIPGQNMYKMSDSKSTWVYVRDAENKVIGRMAYQVLPQGKTSIGLNDVLLGIYNHEEWSTSNHGEKGSDSIRSSWNSRIGKDISELNFTPAHSKDNPSSGTVTITLSNAPDAPKYNIPNVPFFKKWQADDTFVENIYKDGFSKDNPFLLVPSFNDFFAGSFFNKIIAEKVDGATDSKHLLTKELQQTWFRRWFNDGKGTFPEAFYRKDTDDAPTTSVLHRFNLGHIEGDTTGKKWYDDKRFANCDPNADDFQNCKVVDRLLADAADFVPGDNKISADVAPGSGLPFLTIIGKDPGSFSSLEMRRKQIAANLNDYCDEDSIPTSNISAKTWDVMVEDKMPQFTGNERTPYINEFALELNLNPNWTHTATETKLELKPEVRLFTEIIDIYGGLQASNYNLKACLKNIKYEGTITVKCTAILKNGNTQSFEVSLKDEWDSTTLPNPPLYEVNSQFPEFPDSGYAVGKSNEPIKLDKKIFDLTEEIAKNVPLEATLDISKSKIEFKVTKVGFMLNAAALFDKDGTGVDFVRGPKDEITATSSFTFEFDNTFKLTNGNDDNWKKFYISGMEVRDPRQNLNFTKANTSGQDYVSEGTPESDWKCEPKLQNRIDTESMPGDTVGSMEIQETTCTGKLNESCSKPNRPFFDGDKYSSSIPKEDWGWHYDQEAVGDPAAKKISEGKYATMSTAYIANAPMRSLWELGAIHRGRAWQTINLKWAGGIAENSPFSYLDNKRYENLSDAGISYKQGDAGILDQVKLTSATHSSGKVNVNMLHTYSEEEGPINADDNKTYQKYPVFREWDKTIIKALLYNIHYNQQLGDLRSETPPKANGTVKMIDWGGISEEHIKEFQTKPTSDYLSRAAFIGTRPTDDSKKCFGEAFGIIDGWDGLADAQQEEFIGKTINLLTAEQTAQTTIQAIVVVQTIKSINADDNTEITKTALKSDNTVETLPKQVTKKNFDFKTYTDNGKTKYMYFDEITSELRALVTIKKIQQKNGGIRLRLHSIQYY